MQTFQLTYTRAPTRLSHNKENMQTHNLELPKRSSSLQNESGKQKHNYDIYFPKDAIKKKPFMDQPENYDQTLVL